MAVPDDTYIQSSDNPSNDVFEVALSNPSGTPTAGPLKYRIWKKLNNATVINLKMALMQGTTEIASWLHNDIPSTPTNYSKTLTGPQFAAITDFNDLRIRGTANPSAVLWTPANISTNAWFDAQGGTYVTGTTTVTQWADRSGNGRHLSSSGGGGMTAPSYASNKITTDAGFEGFDTWAVALPAGTFDVAFVATPKANNKKTFILRPGTTQEYLLIFSNSVLTSIPGLGLTGFDPSVTWADNLLGQCYFSITAANASNVRLNGNAASTPNAGFAGNSYVLSTTPIMLGGWTSGDNMGDTCEVIFMTAGQSSTDREKIEGYLAWKWDGILGGSTLVTALPSGHPYKSAAP